MGEIQRLIDDICYVNKEEMNMSVEHDFVALSAKMEMERGMQKVLLKKHVG